MTTEEIDTEKSYDGELEDEDYYTDDEREEAEESRQMKMESEANARVVILDKPLRRRLRKWENEQCNV